MNKIKPSYYEDKKWYEDRNREILKDKQAGMSNVELITKYQITPARIKYLIKHERAKHEFKR